MLLTRLLRLSVDRIWWFIGRLTLTPMLGRARPSSTLPRGGNGPTPTARPDFLPVASPLPQATPSGTSFKVALSLNLVISLELYLQA